MKKIILLLALCAFLAQEIRAQVTFDSNFKSSVASLPYGDPIVLEGHLSSAPDSLFVTLIYSVLVSDGSSFAKKILKKAEIQGKDWSVGFDPLPADTRVIIHFDLFSGITPEDKQKLETKLEHQFDLVGTDIVTAKLKINDPTTNVRKILTDALIKKLDDEFKNYQISGSTTLYQYIGEYLQNPKVTDQEIRDYISSSIRVSNFIKGYNLGIAKFNVDSLKKLDGVPAVPFERITSATLNDRELLEVLNALENKYAAGSNAYKILDGYKKQLDSVQYSPGILVDRKNTKNLIDQILEPIKISIANSYTISSQSKSLATNDLLKYAGVDVGALVFPKSRGDSNPAFIGYFFSISPYLHEFFGKNPGRFIKNFTPTLGWGLSSSLANVKTPFYYTGLTYKINQAFRFTAGATFFKNDVTKPQFEWMFGAGFMLQLSSAGDLIRIFNSAKSQLGNSGSK